MRNAAKPGFLPGKLCRGAAVLMMAAGFKSCVPAGRAGKGRKSGRAVPVIEFMEQEIPHKKSGFSQTCYFSRTPGQVWRPVLR